jgi:histidyl-tRNA synthetase
MQKPSNAQGTRDFGPDIMRKRDFILDTTKNIYKKYGFEPLETPALENLETLEGKYGEEGAKLLYKIRSNSPLSAEVSKAEADRLSEIFPSRWISGSSKLGLRYDLTVPFARFVVQHRNDITFPFRRFQVQNVWRADRPAKGRFREFTQCDADCIGSDSLLHEADLIQIYNEVFVALGLGNAILKINHRKFLEALVDELSLDFPVGRFTSTLDKLDKIGEEGVMKELISYGVDEAKCRQLFSIIGHAELNSANLETFAKAFNNNTIAKKAIADLTDILNYLADYKLDIKVELDLSLARGLDYYTGCIFEAVIPESGMGSVSGGGRYDDLTGVFGLNDVSGVGISFGIDRIYEILEAQDLWPANLHINNNVLICHFDKSSKLYAVKLASQLRKHNINTIVYPDDKRINKQFDFANKIGVRYAIVIGDSEMETGRLTVKNLMKGEQKTLSLDESIAYLTL